MTRIPGSPIVPEFAVRSRRGQPSNAIPGLKKIKKWSLSPFCFFQGRKLTWLFICDRFFSERNSSLIGFDLAYSKTTSNRKPVGNTIVRGISGNFTLVDFSAFVGQLFVFKTRTNGHMSKVAHACRKTEGETGLFLHLVYQNVRSFE